MLRVVRHGWLAACLALALGMPFAAAAGATVVTNAADDLRTGWYPDQSALTPDLVTSTSFGQLFEHDLGIGDQIDAQPLVASNTLLVVTERNNVYGLDPATGAERWHRQVGDPVRTEESTRMPKPDGGFYAGCDVPRHYTGITGTPVVDDATGTAYFFAKHYASGDTGSIVYSLHAVDVTTGVERDGFPKDIPEGLQADNHQSPYLGFSAQWELQRPGLLLMDGVVYAAFAGHCDRGPYEGWVVGMSAADGSVTGSWVAVDANPGAGIWQSGGGLVSDGPGRIILETGNGRSPSGTTPMAAPPASVGSSAVRLQVGNDGSLSSADFFAPYDASLLDANDVDFGSGGPIGLPDAYFGTADHPHLMVATGKQGIVYLLDRDDLGGYRTGDGGGDRVLQEAGPIGGVWSRPSVWPGDGGWIWVNTASGQGGQSGGGDGRLEALGYGLSPSGDPLLTSGEGESADAFSVDSGSPVVTSDGTTGGSGIVWIEWAPYEGYGAQLRAYRAVPAPDANGVGRPVLLGSWPMGRSSKFQPPGVGTGRIYVTSRGCETSYEASCAQDTPAAVRGFGSPVVQPLSGASLQFGATEAGLTEQSSERLTATRDLTITAVSSSDGHFTVGTPSLALPATLHAGDVIDVPVTFAPDGVRTFAATLTASTDQGDVTLGLSGDGVSSSPVLRAVAPVSFGGVFLGSHATRGVRLYDDGAADVHVSAVGGPAAGSGFLLPDPPATPFTIPAGKSVILEVEFDPQGSGQFDGTIDLTSDGGNRSLVLSGSAATPPHLDVSALDVPFGTVVLGEQRELSVTVTNTGGSSAVISRSQPPGGGPFFALTSLTEGSTIGPGETRELRVRFAPTTAGPAGDGWSLNANDGLGRRDLTFEGAGAPLSAVLRTSGPLDVGSVEPGAQGRGSVVLANDSDTPLPLTLAVDGPFAAAGSVTVPARGQAPVPITFAPPLVGPFAGTLHVRHGDEDVDVPLSGAGTRAVVPPPTLAPSITMRRQHLAAIARSRALRLTCTVQAAARCSVIVSISATDARRLHLLRRVHGKTYKLASGAALAKKAGPVTVRVRLSRTTAAALSHARSLRITVRATATLTSGGGSGTMTMRWTLRR